MSRRHSAEKREVLPDPKFGDVVLSKFMNCLMYDGKQSIAEGIVYGALDRVRERGAQDPVRVFDDGLANVKLEIEVRSLDRKIARLTYRKSLAPRMSSSA